MIIEMKSQSMTDLVGLEAVKVKTKDPYVEDIYCDSSPGGKISCKNRVVFDAKALILHDEPHDAKDYNTCSYTYSHVEIFTSASLCLLGHISESLSSIFTFYIFLFFELFHIQILYFIHVLFFNANHSRYLLMI